MFRTIENFEEHAKSLENETDPVTIAFHKKAIEVINNGFTDLHEKLWQGDRQVAASRHKSHFGDGFYWQLSGIEIDLKIKNARSPFVIDHPHDINRLGLDKRIDTVPVQKQLIQIGGKFFSLPQGGSDEKLLLGRA